MAHFKLGDTAKARAALAQLRALLSDPASAATWANDAEAQAFLKEAEALIEAPPAATQPAATQPATSASTPTGE